MTTSIIIRALNEERYLGTTLQAIAMQTLRPDEVILVDSGSVDRTLEIAERAGARVLRIRPEDFTYGRALNLGASAARGELLVNLSAHAIPASKQWLEALVSAYYAAQWDGVAVGGVYGRQLPMPDASPLVRRDYLECYGEKARRSAVDPFFSNSNSLVPRYLWRQTPFDEHLPYSEDLAWMGDRQQEGLLSVYAPDAVVYHSHEEGLRQLYRRRRAEGEGMGRVTGMRWTAADAVLAWVREIHSDAAFFNQSGIGWWSPWRWRSPVYRLAKILGGYVGRRRAYGKGQ